MNHSMRVFVTAVTILSWMGLRPLQAATPPAERRIEEALAEPLRSPLDFLETPLSTVMTTLAEEYDIPIQFDDAALEAVAQSPETEVSITISDVTLRAALNLLFEQTVDVTYIVDNEVLLVTTEDEASAHLEVRVYRVDDFRAVLQNEPPKQGASAWALYSPLIDVITDCVEPETWHENGTGDGRIKQLYLGILVVAQTQQVHPQIESLLADLRRVRRQIETDAKVQGSPFDDL
jgi:hypothetical protein